jgi:hypothetical protein
MANPKTPAAPVEASAFPVSVNLGVANAATAISALNRLRTLQDSVAITVRGERSAVLRVLDTVKPGEMVRDSVAVSVRAPRSAVVTLLKGIEAGKAGQVSAMLSLRGGKPAGG